MPKVPQQQGPTQRLQVVTQPRARASALPESPFVGALNEAAKIVGEIRERKVKASSSEALLNYEREVQSLLYAQGEGYAYKRGRDALDQSKDVLKRLDDLKLKYADALDEPEAKRLYLERAESHALRARKAVMTHAERESRFYQASVLESELENTVTNAGLFYRDPENFQQERMRGEAAVLDSLRLQGLDTDPEIVKSRIGKFRDSYYSSAVTSAIASKDLRSAETLYKASSGAVSPKVRKQLRVQIDTLKRSLEDKNTLVRAQGLVDAVFDPDNKSPYEMEQEIRKRASGKVEKQAVADLRSRLGAWKADRIDRESEAYEKGYDLVVAGTDPDALPPDIVDDLSPERREWLRRVYQSRFGKKSGRTVGGGKDAKNRALAYFHELSLEDQANANPAEIAQRYGAGSDAVLELRKLVNKAREGAETRVSKLTDSAWKHPYMKSLVNDIIIPSVVGAGSNRRLTSVQREQEGKIRQAVRRIIALRMADFDGDRLSDDQVRDLAIDLNRAFVSDDDEFTLASITPEELRAIEIKYEQKTGKPASTMMVNDILEAYRAMKGKD